MKKLIPIGILFILISTNVFSQGRRHTDFDYDKFKSEKIAFITQAIELSPAEAEKFWPVYNEYEKKKWELISDKHEMERNIREGLKEMPDQEYIKLSKELSSFPVMEGKLNVEYNDKFLKILTPRKVVLLYIAELEFRNTLLRKYRDGEKKREGVK